MSGATGFWSRLSGLLGRRTGEAEFVRHGPCDPVRTMSWSLYDALNLAATAVDEAQSGRRENAGVAWLEACASVGEAFPVGSARADALAAVVEAAHPAGDAQCADRAALSQALGKASAAALIAMDRDADCAADMILDASPLAALTSCRDALRIVLAAIWEQALAGSEVTA